MYKLTILDKVSFILVVLGALNWGLVGLFNLDLIQALLGGNFQVLTRIIYILVGVSGISMILFLFRAKKGRI